MENYLTAVCHRIRGGQAVLFIFDLFDRLSGGLVL